MSNKTAPTPENTLDHWIGIIRKGPPTPQAIGEALWQVESRQLFQPMLSSMKTFFPCYANLNAKKGAKIIEEWKRSEQGRAVVGHQPVPDVEEKAQKRDAASTTCEKTTTTTCAETPPAASSPIGVISEKNPDAMTVERMTTEGPATADHEGAGKPQHQTGIGGEGSHTIDKPAVVTLKLADIQLDPNIQVRESLNKAKVKEYAERKRAGDVFPCEVVFEINGRHVLADGWHRHAADEEIGRTVVEVELRHGSIDDALLYAITANSTHGSAWTNKDKRRCVALLVKRFDRMSDRVIAEKAKVSHTFVSRMRQQLAMVASSDTRIGRDKKKRRVANKRNPLDAGEGRSRPKERARADGNPSSSEHTEPRTDRQNHSETSTEGKTNSGDESEAGQEWHSMEDFLLARVNKHPTRVRKLLGERLHSFADRHCC